MFVKVPVRRAKVTRRDETLALPRHMAPECREVIGVLACRFSASLMTGEHQSNELEPPWTCLRGGLISGNNAVGCRSSDGYLYKSFVQEHDNQSIKLLHSIHYHHTHQYLQQSRCVSNSSLFWLLRPLSPPALSRISLAPLSAAPTPSSTPEAPARSRAHHLASEP